MVLKLDVHHAHISEVMLLTYYMVTTYLKLSSSMNS